MLSAPEEVASYTLSASLDEKEHVVHGEGTIRFTNRTDTPTSSLWVHLYMNAFKNSKSVFLSEIVPGFRGSGSVTRWGAIDVKKFALKGSGEDLWARANRRPNGPDDESEAEIPLSAPIAPGQTIEIEMAWDTTLPSIVERTGFQDSFHMVGQWFPKLARLDEHAVWAHFPFHHLAEFYSDFGNYDVTLEVPDAYVVGATGVRSAALKEGAGAPATGHRRVRYTQKNVHDFAWTAWDHFVEREEKMGDVAVRILFPEGYDAIAERELATMRFAFPHFRARYGPYPYETLTLVHPLPNADEAGGMEYPTLITTGGAWAVPSFARAPEIITVHEFAHQYFYGLVASNEMKWPYLDEGFTSFAEMEAMQTWYGHAAVGRLGPLEVDEYGAQGVIGARNVHDDVIAQPAHKFRSGATYGSLIYSRMASILGTLRRTYGDAFIDAFGVYARRFRFRHPEPADFYATMESELGKDAAAFLEEAIAKKGWVDFAVGSVFGERSAGDKGLFGESANREKREGTAKDPVHYEGFIEILRRGTLVIPVEVEIRFKDGSRTRTTWDGKGEATRIPLDGPSYVASVVIDPDGKVLVDQDLSNNTTLLSGTPPSDVTFSIASLVSQWLLQVLFQ